MKIYRFKNGDACPCCGSEIQGMTPAELEEISLAVHAIARLLDRDDWILRPEADAIEISTEDLEAAL